MRYDVVVATLNRQASLETCLSMIERQSELPSRVIVVDASDDHSLLRRSILPHRSPKIEWIFVGSDVKSSPRQRNLGFQYVHSEVVLTPDDDCMLYSSAAAEMMNGFRADASGVVAAVSGTPVQVSPLADRFAQKERVRTLADSLQPLRNRVEALFVPHPYNTFAQSLWRHRSIPAWVNGERFRLVEHIGGGYLGVRAELAKEHGFDETLGSGIGYALLEDVEFSLRLQRMGYLLVAAQHAPIFHDAHPGTRAGGLDYGFCWIINCIYACRKNLPEESESWTKDLPRFLDYKIALYRARAIAKRDSYSIDVLEGAKRAMSVRQALMEAEVEELPIAYEKICRKFIRR